MEIKKLLLMVFTALAFMVILPLAFGAIVYDLSPADLFRTTSSSVFFDWEVNTTSLPNNPMPSYLYITELGNESSYKLNYTLRYCLNGSSCNTTVSGFSPGYYQWYVVTGESALSPTLTSSNSQPYDTRDRAANVTGTVAETYDTTDSVATLLSTNLEPFNTLDRAAIITSTNGVSYNTTDNDTIDITYTNSSGSTETCNVTLENSHSLPVANVTASINSACNLTASGTGNFTLTSEGTGTSQFIIIDGGNATNVLGLTTGVNYTGSVNNSLNFRYSVNGATEICNVTLPKSSGLAASDVLANLTESSCNVTGTDLAYIQLQSYNTSSAGWIYMDAGTANDIIGFTAGINTTGFSNNTLGLNYTVAGATNYCSVSLTKSATLTAESVVNSILSSCDLQGPNESVSYVNLNTNSTGANEFIIFNNGSALGLLGFTQGVNYTGSVNSTFDLTYSVNGTTEYCNVSLTKDSQLNTTEILANMTQANTQCNLTITNASTLTLTGSGYGEGEYITVDRGNVLGILGFDIGTVYGSQVNTTSDARWFEIVDGGVFSNTTLTKWKNESGFVAMTLNKDNGDLWLAGTIDANLSWNNISNYPSACPGTSAVTTIGDSVTCTDYWVNEGENLTNIETINITERSAAPGEVSVGMMYYDSDINDLCIYNSTGWFGALSNVECS